MLKMLNSKQQVQLYKWLEEHNINPIRLPREFSDGWAFAHLMKKLHPKLVDLHNYARHTSTERKLANWETINFRVLNKIGLHQPKAELEKLAKGTPGVIEYLLYQIMMLQIKSKEAKEPNVQEQMWIENDELLVVNVNKKIGDALIKVPQKMILFSTYEQALHESQAKDAYIELANQKIAHLENIIELKNERIEEMSGQLAKQSMRNFLK